MKNLLFSLASTADEVFVLPEHTAGWIYVLIGVFAVGATVVVSVLISKKIK